MAFLAGCATNAGVRQPAGVPVTEMRPDERGFVVGTGIESQDLVSVTDRMSRSILGIPEIARAQGRPYIVLEPVVNNTRFPINKDIFLTRIRTQLNSKATGRVSFLDRVFIMSRSRKLTRPVAFELSWVRIRVRKMSLLIGKRVLFTTGSSTI